jgi:hypothetical protein
MATAATTCDIESDISNLEITPKFETEKFDQLEKEILERISTYKGIDSLWKSLDFNGNNIVSLAEIDKFVIENFPLLNNKPALIRAYKKTTMKDGDGDSWVEKKEFRALLSNLFYFNKLFQAFQALDEDNDRRLDLGEFKESCSVLGLNYSDEEAEVEFKSIDKNGGGIVLFIEFCEWYSDKNKLDELEEENDPNDFGRVKK